LPAPPECSRQMTCFAKRQMSSRNCPNGRAEPIGDCRARVSIVSYSAGSLRHRTVQPSQHRPEAFQLALNEVVPPRPGSRGCNANKVRQTVSLNWRRRSRFSVCHRWHTIGTASWHPFFHRDGSIPLGHGFCVFGSRILRVWVADSSGDAGPDSARFEVPSFQQIGCELWPSLVARKSPSIGLFGKVVSLTS
jgi:hypothetical protein